MYTKLLETVLVLSVLWNIVSCQTVPRSSCPKVFRYLRDGNQWIGVIRLPSNRQQSVYRLAVNMALPATLSSQYVGNLEVFGDRMEAVRRIASGTSIGFKVMFPIQDVLPEITSIVLNRVEYCRNDPYFDGPVTSIALQYVLYSEPISPGFIQQDSVIDDPNFAQDFTSARPIQIQNYRPKPQQIRPTNQYEDYYRPQNPPTKPTPEEQPAYFVETAPQTSKPVEKSFKCGVPSSSSSTSNALIVGGDTTKHGEWPWLTAIFMKKVASLQFICSGSLISHNHVVTAGHCVVQKKKQVGSSELILKFGSHNIQDWADAVVKTMEVQDVIVHPNFESTSILKNDIAILKVTRLEFTEYIIPVCLWQDNNDLNLVVGQQGSVIGWGRDENGLAATPEPRLSKVPIVSTESCRASRQEFFQITSETTLCGGKRDGTGPCNGDSGGGLYLHRNGKWTIRGIVSNSLKDPESNSCDLNEYIVYTDASKYTSWINNVMDS